MRKVILVTSTSSPSLISRFLDYEIVGLDEGIDVARQSGAKLSLAISTFEEVSLQHVLSFMPKDKIVRYTNSEGDTPYLKVVDYLFSLGIEEIVILASLQSRFDLIHGSLLTLKNAKGNVMIQDDNSIMMYYQKGSHVINKQDYSMLYIIGFPQANISMEHVERPVKNLKLDFTADHALKNAILERVAVLKVNEGGVLLVLARE